MDNNIFEIIAKHLGVELNEEFLVDTYKAKFRITKNNFERADYPSGNTTEWSPADKVLFFDLLRKYIEIKKLPWIPEDNEKCWVYNGYCKDKTGFYFFEESVEVLAYLKLGLLFRTKEEAETLGKQRYEALMDEYVNGTICKEV